ncbi:PadR family transcriptional regulator [Amycolatopsis sp. cg5]|uniref:PadR family transcriptional regulator n=1 Tax=Amycolatopsis sp. cg5 TaxID=3238802 RepID=UPI0035234E9F
MSATRLLVLGVVRMYGQAHGYQVRRELLSWSADKWGNVQPGSIYHALKKMTVENLLEQVADTGESGGPDRTAYRLTAEGEEEFETLLSTALSTNDPSPYTLSAAVTFMTALPRERVVSLLKHRLMQMEGQEQASLYAREHFTDFAKPAHVSELYRMWHAHAETDVRWLREMIGRLEQGEYVMAGEDETVFGEPTA